jgi:hypothetical protein
MEKRATVYDNGEVFRPEAPVDLEPNTRSIISIEPASAPREPIADEKTARIGTLVDLLIELAGTVEAPVDWSAEHDHDLHGTMKRSEGKCS